MDPITIGLTLASQFAPSIIKYFSNSDTAASVAGQVIDIAKTVTGRETPAEAVTTLKADPALAIQFQLAVMANDAALEQAYLADVQNARARDVELAKAGTKNRRADIMLALTFLGIVALVVLMVFRDIDANTALGGMVILLIGKFVGQWETGFNFEFGTTRTSKVKDETISSLSK